MTKQVPTRPVSAQEAGAFFTLAEEFLDAAAQMLGRSYWNAATSLATHSAINAADGVTALRLGRRASGDSHEQVLILLKGVHGAEDVPRHLRPLLRLKPRAEYDPAPVREKDARRAVRLAGAVLDIARTIAAGARS
jgi:HEPN domain-containing protein